MVNELLLRDASQVPVEWSLQMECLRQKLLEGLGAAMSRTESSATRARRR